jgi:glycosyltransferase involved in cell wall biosynthesis
VLDNDSPDGTADVVRSYDDERIRLYVNDTNIGPLPNHNRVIELARGRYLKILHADDALAPTCLEKMVSVLDENERVGMVFCRRHLVVEQPDLDLIWFANRQREIHHAFGGLGRVNPGRKLYEAYVAQGFPANWIGEQTATMVRREAYERVGLFNPFVWQYGDMQMWIRVMLAFDVGFVDEELVDYRFGHANLTAANAETGRGFADRLWIIESLMEQEPSLRDDPALQHLRRAEWLMIGKQLVQRTLRRRPLGERGRLLAEYAAYRLRTRVGATPPPMQLPLARYEASGDALVPTPVRGRV